MFEIIRALHAEGNTIVLITHDEGLDVYKRQILPSTDANNGTQLSFDNVIVLFTDFDVYPDPGGSGYDLSLIHI